MSTFYEHFDINLIKVAQKNVPNRPLFKYKNLYYWVLHQALTDRISYSDIRSNETYPSWTSLVSVLDSRRIIGLLRPVLEGRNNSKDLKWIELSNALITQLSNLLFIEKNDISHIIKCISIISRFSSNSLSNGSFDNILLSAHFKEFKNPIDTSHIIKGYVKAKRFEPFLYSKLLKCIINYQGPPTERNASLAIALNAISKYWWHWNGLEFYINDLIHPKDAISLINVMGKFDISDEIKDKIIDITSKFVSKIIENPSKYNSKDISSACKSLVSIALLNPKSEQLIINLRKFGFNDILVGNYLIDVLSSNILAGIAPPIDLVIKCMVELDITQCTSDDIYKLRIIVSSTGFSALGFKRMFKRVLSKHINNDKKSLESLLVLYYLNGIKPSAPISPDFKFKNLESMPKFQILSKIYSILKENNETVKHFLYHFTFDSSKLLLSLRNRPRWLIEQYPSILLTLNKYNVKNFNEIEEIVYNSLGLFSKSNLFDLLDLSTSNLKHGDIIWQFRYMMVLKAISNLELFNEDILFLRKNVLTGLECNDLFKQEIDRFVVTENHSKSNEELKNFIRESNLNILACIFNGDNHNEENFKMRSIWNLIKFITIKPGISNPFTKDIFSEFHPRPMEISLMANLCTTSTPILKVRHDLYWILDPSNFPKTVKSYIHFKHRIRSKYFRRFIAGIR